MGLAVGGLSKSTGLVLAYGVPLKGAYTTARVG